MEQVFGFLKQGKTRLINIVLFVLLFIGLITSGILFLVVFLAFLFLIILFLIFASIISFMSFPITFGILIGIILLLYS